MTRTHTLVLILFALLILNGCGTYVPQLHEPWEEADVSDYAFVSRIKNSIYCELKTSIHSLATKSVDYGQIDDRLIPANYGVQVTLMLQVDETGSLAPGLVASKGLGGTDLFTFGTGALLSSQATRADTYYSFFSAAELKESFGGFDSTCGIPLAPGIVEPLDRHGSSPLLSGDLGIRPWLLSAVLQQSLIPSDKLPESAKSKVDVLSYHVRFIITTTGTANPTFKFVSLASATSSSFLSASRMRTHDLVITMGPDVSTTVLVKAGSRKRTILASPGEAAFSVHLSTQIGAAVANALR